MMEAFTMFIEGCADIEAMIIPLAMRIACSDPDEGSK